MPGQIETLTDLQSQVVPSLSKETPAIYLPWAQRILNPFPLASSGAIWGDTPMPWNCRPIIFTVSVLVNTTNNATNFWTLNLTSVSTAGLTTAICNVNTSTATAGAPKRLSTTTITLPPTTDVWFQLQAVATLSPGPIFIFPALALLRLGN